MSFYPDNMEAAILTEIMDAALLAKNGAFIALESDELDEHAICAQFEAIQHKMRALETLLEKQSVVIYPRKIMDKLFIERKDV